MRKSRVLLAAAGLFLMLLGVWGRVAWLQLALHDHFVARAAENQLSRHKLIPRRGELLDCNGRVLAHDLPVSRIAVIHAQLKDAAGAARALAPLLGLEPGALRRRIESTPGFLLLANEAAPELGDRVRALHLSGVIVDDDTRRDYRLGNAAAEILGRTNSDNVGADGLELQYDSELGGQSGWITMVHAGKRHTLKLPGATGRPARDGATLELTIDGDLQAIVEQHLARAVDTLKAKRGFAIFIDPWTGEVRAAACVPHLPAGKAKNWTLTDMYEPGSTFKVVVAGATLEEKTARPDEYIVAGHELSVPGRPIHDSHEHPGYTFFGAIQNSSNIVCAKLGMRLGAERLYRYATSLGFGEITGIEFPGEAAGKLRPVSAWQPRSTPTIAIGQEVAVTPLQLALAYAAIANGGVLMEPLLTRELRSADGRVLRRWAPQPARRVFSEATTAELSEMLCAVVDSGTATLARLHGLRIAGKTGTAQKVDPNTHRYGNRMFISSFAGIAPADHPRLVGVVVIDEPGGSVYYGGQAAAPVFREVMLDLMRSPSGLLGPSNSPVASRPPAVPGVTAPDLRLLPRREAEKRLADFGLRASFEGTGPRVLSQSPAAGAPVERGGAVVAFLSPPRDSLGRVLPALVGLPIREALRLLSLRQVKVHLEGSGLVVRQEPAPGTALPLPGGCRIWCADPGIASGPQTFEAALVGAPAHRP
jgi:stage V sporulation protein D (sporulation-specific penicillin-binding protein)